jgi:hypothetical protein
MLVNRPVTSAPRLPPPGCSTVPRTSSLLLPKHGAKRAMPAALGAGESSWARGEAGHEHWFRRGAAAPVEGRRKTRRPRPPLRPLCALPSTPLHPQGRTLLVCPSAFCLAAGCRPRKHTRCATRRHASDFIARFCAWLSPP